MSNFEFAIAHMILLCLFMAKDDWDVTPKTAMFMWLTLIGSFTHLEGILLPSIGEIPYWVNIPLLVIGVYLLIRSMFLAPIQRRNNKLLKRIFNVK